MSSLARGMIQKQSSKSSATMSSSTSTSAQSYDSSTNGKIHPLEAIATTIETQLGLKNIPESPLDELRETITKLEKLIEKVRRSWWSESNRYGGLVMLKNLEATAATMAKPSKDDEDDDEAKEDKIMSESRFIPFDSQEEEDECVELLRRMAELAVRGECAETAALLVKEKRSNNNASTQSLESNHKHEELSEREIESYLTLFDHFCERNALALIVNVATGVAFQNPSSQESQPNKILDLIMLPPLGVATQAVQSMAILIQNVSTATSLYYLLSNNLVNNLIDLPLEYYQNASSGGNTRIDLAELSTNFVSFLKSLAMRINAQTLQFFLSNDALNDDANQTSDLKVLAWKEDIDIKFQLYERALEYGTIDQDSFVRVTAMNICLNILRLATRKQNQESEHMPPLQKQESSNSVYTTESTSSTHADKQSILRLQLPIVDRVAIARYVSHPARVAKLLSPIFSKLASLTTDLLESIRSLEKLQISSTITVQQLISSSSQSINNNSSTNKTNGQTNNKQVPQKKTNIRGNYLFSNVSPHGTDHPFVNSTTTRISSKLDSANETSKKQSSSDEKLKFQRISHDIQNLLADLQDELLLLDDVLKVGLISLNEQAIEMMLATFIYPFLLQPLLFNMTSAATAAAAAAAASSSSSSTSPADKEKAFFHPFWNNLQEQNQKVTDYAPLKTAYFGIAAVFHTITNSTLLSLLFTALFHPYAPDAFAGGSITIEASPNIITWKNNKYVIRIDDDNIPNRRNCTYMFGREDSTFAHSTTTSNGTNNKKRNDEYIFVLAPALSYILQHCKPGTQGSDMQEYQLELRLNPYRRVILQSFLSSSFSSSNNDTTNLQQIAIFAMNAATTSFLERCGSRNNNNNNEEDFYDEFLSNILFGSNLLVEGGLKKDYQKQPEKESVQSSVKYLLATLDIVTRDENDELNQFLMEIILCLSFSVMTSTIHINGIWRLDYNSTAAHSLILLLQSLHDSLRKRVIDNVLHIFETIQSKSKIYLSSLPAYIASSRHDSSNFTSTTSSTNRGTNNLNKNNDNNSSNIKLATNGGAVVAPSTSSTTTNTSSQNSNTPSFLKNDQINLIMNEVIIDTLDIIGKKTLSLTNSSFETIIGTNTKFQQVHEMLCFQNSYYYVLHRQHVLYLLNKRDSQKSAVEGGGKNAGSLKMEKNHIFMELFVLSIISMLQLDGLVTYLSNLNQGDRNENDENESDNKLSCLNKESNPEIDDGSNNKQTENPVLNHSLSTYSINFGNDDESAAIYVPQKITSPLSSTFRNALFHLDEDYSILNNLNSSSQTENKKRVLKSGTVVSLVGRAAFPCVCEVTDASSYLFNDENACVVADGIKWQSLYMVILGRYMILAEPERRGCGNGRIVTSCQLACLSINKDKPSMVHSSSARRLLLVYTSFEKNPPGTFIHTASQHSQDSNNSPIIHHSTMDLWFEDEESAESAYEALATKINKAKGKRGQIFRDVFSS